MGFHSEAPLIAAGGGGCEKRGGMPGSATSDFTDAEHYRAELSDVFASVVITSPGAFTARTTRNTLNRFHLLRVRENLPRVAFASLPADRVFISLSFDPGGHLIWRGLTLEPGEIMLHGRGERLHQRTVGPCSWGFISLSPGLLAAAFKTETGRAVALPVLGRVLRTSPHDLKCLMRVQRDAARLAETRPHILSHPKVIHAMEQELEGALMACLTNCEVRPESAAMRQASEIMVRFEDVLAAHPYQKMRLAEVCRELDVTGRMVHTYCGTFLGVTPQKYMRLRRLHLVHAAILRGNSESAGVAEYARWAGFTDPGRFAARYRAVFGETPATTLRRARDT